MFTNGFTSKTTAGLMLLAGGLGLLAVLTLVLFFVGLYRNIPSLSFMGSLNDTINAVTGVVSAVLASVLHPAMRKSMPRLSPFLLVAAWTGAVAIGFGSWLIVTGRSGVQLSSYYYFYGNGLIGLWVWFVNRTASRQEAWPRSLARWGMLAGAVMMIGLLGLYGILLGPDGNEYSPLLLVAGLGFLGIGILYPIWCLRLGRWIGVEKEAAPSVRAR